MRVGGSEQGLGARGEGRGGEPQNIEQGTSKNEGSRLGGGWKPPLRHGCQPICNLWLLNPPCPPLAKGGVARRGIPRASSLLPTTYSLPATSSHLFPRASSLSSPRTAVCALCHEAYTGVVRLGRSLALPELTCISDLDCRFPHAGRGARHLMM